MRNILPLFASVAAMPLALVSTPVSAQDAGTQAAPPPVVSTVPQTAPAPAAPGRVFAPTAPVVQQVPETPAPVADATPAPTQRATATRSTRTTTVTRTAAPAAAAPAPAPAATFTPPEPQPASAPAATTQAAPAPAPAPAAQTEQTNTQNRAPVWRWLALAAVIVLGAIGFLAARRRREADEDYYVEDTPPNYEVEPAVAAAPAAVAAAETSHSEVERADADDVAALTAGDHDNRPWLEFALRPVRAGTNVDEALVEVELTVGNAGSETAKDVRISTFMLADHGSAMERMLTDAPPAGAVSEQVTIPAGEGARIEATLARPRATLREEEGESFRPVVVAEARYTLPDGTEGRTSASFDIGVAEDDEEGFEPVTLGQTRIYDNVEARLHGEPVHA